MSARRATHQEIVEMISQGKKTEAVTQDFACPETIVAFIRGKETGTIPSVMRIENRGHVDRIPLQEFYTQMKKTLLLPGLLMGILLGVLFSHAYAQSSTASDPLFNTVQSLDTKFFGAYNQCDLATVSSMVADDLEFYHDVTGFSPGRQSLLDGLKNNICGKVTRELTEVGEAKFITLWQNNDGVWRITRVLSFDHHALTS